MLELLILTFTRREILDVAFDIDLALYDSRGLGTHSVMDCKRWSLVGHTSCNSQLGIRRVRIRGQRFSRVGRGYRCPSTPNCVAPRYHTRDGSIEGR